METDYIKRLEEENAALRQAINKLEDENSLCNMWKPRWRSTLAGAEIVIGKGTSIGEVACDPSGKWNVYIKGTYVETFESRSEAKQRLVKAILEENNE